MFQRVITSLIVSFKPSFLFPDLSIERKQNRRTCRIVSSLAPIIADAAGGQLRNTRFLILSAFLDWSCSSFISDLTVKKGVYLLAPLNFLDVSLIFPPSLTENIITCLLVSSPFFLKPHRINRYKLIILLHVPRKTLLHKYKRDVDETNGILQSGVLGFARSQQMTSFGSGYRRTTLSRTTVSYWQAPWVVFFL